MAMKGETLSRVNKLMAGRIAIREAEGLEIARVISMADGNHLEIGCLWGGTAILAALVIQERSGPGHVFTIDPMRDDYWTDGDPCIKRMPISAKTVLRNFVLFGVEADITLICTDSAKWDWNKVVPSTVFIDGDHSVQAVQADWGKAIRSGARYVMLHDSDGPSMYPDMVKFIQEVVKTTPGWQCISTVDALTTMERV